MSSTFFSGSNRRRCVKGRPSYVEPSDILLSSSVNQDHNNDDFGQSDYSYMDPVESDDVEDEPITIDLSAFLNENPLLAQSAFESSTENNVASTESSSQFRVTDCEIKPSEIPKVDVIEELYSTNASGVNVENSDAITASSVAPMLMDTIVTLHDSAKENCLSPEKVLTNVCNVPIKDITLNGKKSPIKKLPRARPLGLSNPLKKYKNFMKSKDLNKANEKVFGKYPIVKCEKLDIENLVKNNKIKISNWPLISTENPKNNKFLNKNVGKKAILIKPPLKPKFMRKPISFNKFTINSNRKSQNTSNSILIDKLESVSRPIIIKTDAWKPGIRTSSTPVPAFFRNFIANPTSTSKAAIVCDLLKLNDQTSSPEEEIEKTRKPIFKTVGKVFSPTKNYQLIAPKPTVHSPDVVNITPCLSKPVVEPVVEDYTVIEPYVEDPLSPQKPKPLLTVPIEVLSSPEKQNSSIIVNTESEGKTAKSVFLNGAVRQISFPQNVKKVFNTSVLKKDVVSVRRKIIRESILNKRATIESGVKVNNESPEECSSILKAQNAIVDAMQSACSSLQTKKKHRQIKKEHINIFSPITTLETTSYSSILNENILHGFTDNDFDDLPFCTEDGSNTSISFDILTQPREPFFSKVTNERLKRKKTLNENSPYTSDTLSASECENEDHLSKNLKKDMSVKRRKISSPVRTSKILKSSPLYITSQKALKLDTSVDFPSVADHTEVLNNVESNKIDNSNHVDSSFSFSCSESLVPKTPDVIKSDVTPSSDVDKQPKIPLNDTLNNSVQNKRNTKVLDPALKQDACTRTLRERKCSSTETDKISNNSVKQSPHKRNSFEKTKTRSSIYSKLKIQMKTPPKSTAKVKIKRKSSKPEDIIQEINTITGGNLVSKKNFKKYKKTNLETNNKNSDFSDVNPKDDSESNSSSAHFEVNRLTPQSLSKKKKTLKVCIKRSKRNNNSSPLKVSLNSMSDVIENASVLSENNKDVPSSFREAKVCNMGTPDKEESTTKNDTSVSDCNMEAKKDKCVHEEQGEAMVNLSETSLREDASSTNSDLNTSEFDLSLLTENQNDERSVTDDLSLDVEDFKNKTLVVKKGEKSSTSSPSICDDAGSSEYDTKCENILNESIITQKGVTSSLASENSVNITAHSVEESTIESTYSVQDISKIANTVSLDEKETIANTASQDDKETIANNTVSQDDKETIANTVSQDDKETIANTASQVDKETIANTVSQDDKETIANTASQVDKETIANTASQDDKETITNTASQVDKETIANTASQVDKETIANNASQVDKETIANTASQVDKETIANTANQDDKETIANISRPISDEIQELIEDGSYKNAIVEKESNDISEKSENFKISEKVGYKSIADVSWNKREEMTVDSNIPNNCQLEVLKQSEDSNTNIRDLLCSETPTECVLESDGKETSIENEMDNNSNVGSYTIQRQKSHKFTDVNEEDAQSPSFQTKENLTLVCGISEENNIQSNSVSDFLQTDSSENLDNKIKEVAPLLGSESPRLFLSSGNKSASDESEKFSPCKKIKKCPKLKISFKKNNEGSPDSLKNWFVSKSKKSDESDTDIPKEGVENITSELIDCNTNCSEEKPISHPKVDSCVVQELLSDDDKSSSKHLMSEKTKSSLFDDGLSSQTETPSKETSTEKMASSNDIASSSISGRDASSGDLDNSILDENFLSPPSKTPSDNVIIGGSFNPSIKIKEEPIDYKENAENVQNLQTEPVTYPKKRRGRPPRSSEGGSLPSEESKEDDSKTRKRRTKVMVKKEINLENPRATPKETKVNSKENISSTPLTGGRKKKAATATPITPCNKKKNYDCELVCVPFSMGWMREHVIRGSGKDESDKRSRQSDIYYFAPDGTKLRSMPDISTYLSKHTDIKLSLQHFTFAKELIYREPFEIERDAKQAARKVFVTPKKTSVKTPVKTPTNSVPLPVSSLKQDSSLLRVKISTPGSKKKIAARQRTKTQSEILKSVKQETLDQYLSSESKSSRFSRKIIKKVPFDNSFENIFPKKSRVRTKSQEVGENVIQIKKEVDCSVTEPPKSNLSLSSTKQTVPSNIGQHLNSSLSSATDNSKLSVDKSVPGCSENAPDHSSICERTNVKSKEIKNRLKVKFARKSQNVPSKPCSKFCNFASLREPNIQCCICLCLFHPECIPFKPAGLTRYACVPCVKTRMDESTSLESVLPEIVPLLDCDIELLYPHIDLQITHSNNFNKIFNKFYSPVDPSFMHSQENGNFCPIQPYPVPRAGNPYMSSVPYFQYPQRPPTNLYPISPNLMKMCPKGYTAAASSVPFSTFSSNSSVYSPNSGSLPLLQKFSNAYFAQHQHDNNIASNCQPFTFRSGPTTFYCLRVTNPGSRPVLNVPVSQDQNSVLAAKYTQHPQSKELLSEKVYAITKKDGGDVAPALGVSMLKTILQTTDKLLEKDSSSDRSSKKMKLDCSSGSTGTVCASTSSTDSADSSELLDCSLTRSSSASESDSSKGASGSLLDDNPEKPGKKLKLIQPTETNNSARVSMHAHKNISLKKSDVTNFWNVDKCLTLIFKYLNIPDLLSASLVCHSWNDQVNQKFLWETVYFSGVAVKNWDQCCLSLEKYETRCIDFRGILNQDSVSAWESFAQNINKLIAIEELIFEKVPPFIINKIADTLPQLKKLTCYCVTSKFSEPEIWTTSCEFQLSTLRYLGRLEALKISSMGGINLNDSQESLMPYLPNLTHLILTGFSFKSYMNLECLIQKQQLVSLELGDCIDIEPQIYGILDKLSNLQNLCLQNGGNMIDTKLPDAVSKMRKLKNLELMNFVIPGELPDVLKKMDLLLHFSLWPDNRTEAAQVNFNSFRAATSCTNLKSLCWGILTDDDDDIVPNVLELRDSSGSEIKMMGAQELFQSLVSHYPGAKVELKCLPRSAWSEYCCARNFM